MEVSSKLKFWGKSALEGWKYPTTLDLTQEGGLLVIPILYPYYWTSQSSHRQASLCVFHKWETKSQGVKQHWILVRRELDGHPVSESRSAVSDSLRPHELYSPWNSPGQNTGFNPWSGNKIPHAALRVYMLQVKILCAGTKAWSSQIINK